MLEASSVELFENDKKIMSKSLDYEATSIAISTNGVVAIGAQVYLFFYSVIVYLTNARTRKYTSTIANLNRIRGN